MAVVREQINLIIYFTYFFLNEHILIKVIEYIHILKEYEIQTWVARRVLSLPAFGFLLKKGCVVGMKLLINILCFVGGVFLESESVFANGETCF